MAYRTDDIKVVLERNGGVICGIRKDGCYVVRDDESGFVLPPGEANKMVMFEHFFERQNHRRAACV